MAIPIAKIQEGCCDSDLSSLGLTIFNGDALDKVKCTCDKIIECPDKYILVEEKSFLLGFLDRCCKELHTNFGTYKDSSQGITNLKISELIQLIHPLSIELKEKILAETVTDLFSSSSDKISNTTRILDLDERFDETKDIKIFYLYCKSGKAVDAIMNVWLSRNNKRNMFIECNDLKNYLSQQF